MAYNIFEQLAVFCDNEEEINLLQDMSSGIFPYGVTYSEVNDVLYRNGMQLRITEISEKQKDNVITFLQYDCGKSKNYLNKSNISYYMMAYCISRCSSMREARKLACRLIGKYRTGHINNNNITFLGEITAVNGIELQSLLSKSNKSSYGRSSIPS